MTDASAFVRRAGATRRLPDPRALFLRGFLRHPAMVASVMPSSNRLIRRMLAPVDWERTRLFVEYGPGVGCFSLAALARMRRDARMVAIDTNPDFTAYLQDTIRDPRFEAVTGSAADARRILRAQGAGEADYVLSGLPFSTLPDGIGERIVSETAAMLRPGGAMLVYQTRPHVRQLLEHHFDRIEAAREWWNLPPIQLSWAWKS